MSSECALDWSAPSPCLPSSSGVSPTNSSKHCIERRFSNLGFDSSRYMEEYSSPTNTNKTIDQQDFDDIMIKQEEGSPECSYVNQFSETEAAESDMYQSTSTMEFKEEGQAMPAYEQYSLAALNDLPLYQQSLPMKKFRNVRTSNCFFCAVCGDKPTGYHYDVVSCNGCKTFFRRTVISGRIFKCSKGGNCSFNKDFRCSCRACRFDQCVRAGMNPKCTKRYAKTIQFPNRLIKREIHSSSDDELEEDLEEMNAQEPSTSSVDSTIALPPQIQSSNPFHAVAGLLQDLVIRESKATELRDNYSLFSAMKLNDILKEPCLFGEGLSKKLKSRTCYLQELYAGNPIRFWMISDLRLIAEYAKSFSVFRELCIADQRALLSHIGGFVMLLGQSFYSTTRNQGTTTFPDGIVAIETIQNGRSIYPKNNSGWVYELFSEPVALLRSLGVDNEIFAIMRAIALFSPLDDDISSDGRMIIQKEREKYIDALSRLLFAKEGGDHLRGPSKMVALMSALQKLFQTNEKRRNQFTMFDLTSHIHLSTIGKEIYLRVRDQ